MRPPRARRVVVEARAKLNLGLAVGPKRRDGYHDLVTLFQSISLADTLIVTPRARGFRLVVTGEAAPAGTRGRAAARVRARGNRAPRGVPSGPSNLVLRAARAVSERFGLGSGADFRLIKRIPSQAGLGGGSADAAAAIRGLLALHGVVTERAERQALALELGSDVPFAMRGGTALGRGRGEVLAPVRLRRPFRALLAIPKWGVSTADAFRRLDRAKYPLTLWNAKLRSAKLLGRKQLDAETWVRLGNTFEEVLGPRRPDFESLRDRLRAAGVRTPRMTGSGSAVFGIIPPGVSEERVAGRFVGSEAIHLVRSTRAGLRFVRQP